MRVSIVGAGNGGQALAAYLGLAGHTVRLFDRFPETIEPFRTSRRVTAVGAVEGTVELADVTTDVDAAVDGADVIVISLPGFALDWAARAIAPNLRGTETVLLHPGGVGGALEVRRCWDELGVPDSVALAETDTLLFACRLRRPGEVDVKAVKLRLLVAALPSVRTDDVVARVRPLIAQVVRAMNVLETSLGTLNPIIHPTITLTNAGLIERRHPEFDFYGDGVTPGIARLLEAVDGERLAIAAAFRVPAESLLAWAQVAYGAAADDLVTLYARMARDVYRGIGTPPGLDSRYVTEDVPLGLVPMTVLGAIAGVATPAMNAVVTTISLMTGKDFLGDGRDAGRMGIASLGREEVLREVTDGRSRAPAAGAGGGPRPSATQA
jgi:opine dehydrogenase